MGITFKAEIKKTEQRNDGTWNVKIRVTKGRDVARISTNFYVSRPYLSRKYEITHLETLNSCQAIIDDFRQIVNNLGDEFDAYDVKHLAKYLVSERKRIKSNDLIDFFALGEEHLENLKKEKREGYATSIRNTLLWLKKHYSDLYITRITTGELNKMQLKMLETMNQTSANIHLRNIRRLFNVAIDADNKLLAKYPFRRFKFRPNSKSKDKFLDVETVRKIVFFPDHKLKRVNFARDLFTMSFFLHGMNAKDFYCSTQYKENRIIYIREKTKRKGEKALIAPLVPDEIKEIFDRHRDPEGKRVFDFYKRYSNHDNLTRAINEGLEIISEEIGFPEKITEYWARHSYATIARNDCNIPKDDVSICLTHASGLDVTDNYLKRDWSKIDRAQRAVLNLVYKGIEVNR